MDNAGTGRAFGAGCGTKDGAEAAGRDAARAEKAEHVIKNQDGKTGSGNSCGHDPGNVPGRSGSSRHRAA
ncbi:DUF2188 domain-containing protein, partial [Arthrobacter sp. GCM10027362]|uniref:DUF2188 domain-containing protein n=1 Tax=Arthrobacter sp. GCM10027362 TaxID=3273379 RepID=UPI00362EF87C